MHVTVPVSASNALQSVAARDFSSGVRFACAEVYRRALHRFARLLSPGTRVWLWYREYEVTPDHELAVVF